MTINEIISVDKTVKRIFLLVLKQQLAALDWSQHDLFDDLTLSAGQPTRPAPQLSRPLNTAAPNKA
jgi:hypothetical protein